MPLNCLDATFRSFESNVLPEVNRRGIAALGMKPMSGHGEPIQGGAVGAEELLLKALALGDVADHPEEVAIGHLRRDYRAIEGGTIFAPELPFAVVRRFRIDCVQRRLDILRLCLGHDL